jgi:hypothetical protein
MASAALMFGFLEDGDFPKTGESACENSKNGSLRMQVRISRILLYERWYFSASPKTLQRGNRYEFT